MSLVLLSHGLQHALRVFPLFLQTLWVFGWNPCTWVTKPCTKLLMQNKIKEEQTVMLYGWWDVTVCSDHFFSSYVVRGQKNQQPSGVRFRANSVWLNPRKALLVCSLLFNFSLFWSPILNNPLVSQSFPNGTYSWYRITQASCPCSIWGNDYRLLPRSSGWNLLRQMGPTLCSSSSESTQGKTQPPSHPPPSSQP